VTPVATTTALAVPLSTLVPMKQVSLSSVGESAGLGSASWNFSTGSDSPVSVPWLTNRSFAGKHPHIARNHVAGGEMNNVSRNQIT